MANFGKVIRCSNGNASHLSTIAAALVFCAVQRNGSASASAEESFIHSFALEITEYSNMGTRFSNRASKGYVGTFSTIEKCEKLRSYMVTGTPAMFDQTKSFYQVLTCEPSTLPAAQ